METKAAAARIVAISRKVNKGLADLCFLREVEALPEVQRNATGDLVFDALCSGGEVR